MCFEETILLHDHLLLTSIILSLGNGYMGITNLKQSRDGCPMCPVSDISQSELDSAASAAQITLCLQGPLHRTVNVHQEILRVTFTFVFMCRLNK